MSEKTPIEKISDVINNFANHTISAIAKTYYAINPNEKPTYAGVGNDLDLSVLEIGDIINIHGINSPEVAGLLRPSTKLILGFMSGSHWYHTAIYAGDGNIVEAWTPNVRKVSAEILKTADDVEVYRVDTTEDVKKKAVKFCESKIGLPYNYNWMFIIPIFYPSAKKIENDKYYCSELVWAAYKVAGNIDINAYPEFKITPPICGYAVAPQNIGDNKRLKVIARADGRKKT